MDDQQQPNSSPTISNQPARHRHAHKSQASRPPPSAKPSVLIQHYVAQGLDTTAASEKVIEDLQAALQMSLERYPMQRMIAMDKSFRTSASTLEAATKRLYDIEAKLDAKPGVVQVFAAGLAAGAFVQAATRNTPLILGTVNEMYSNIRKALRI